MDALYLVLSLPETVATYVGLALQMEIRQALLRHVVAGLIAANVLWVLVRDRDMLHPFRHTLTYVVTTLIFVALFWGDITPLGRSQLTTVTAEQVASYGAMQDPEAELVTAHDLPSPPRGPAVRLVSVVQDAPLALVPPGFYWLLKVATETPLQLAKRINSQAHRPLSALVPMEWLMGLELTADLSRALSDWIEGCYKPSLLTDKEFQDAITAKDLLPWGNTPVAQALASRSTIPGSQTGRGYFRRPTALGVTFLSNPDSSALVRCDDYLTAMQLDLSNLLFTTPSPGGTPLSEVFARELGLTAEQQARIIINREMRRIMQSPVPAPSLAGIYGATAGASAVLRGAAGAAQGALRGGGLGAVVGGTSAVLAQAEQHVQRFLWWLGLATWLIWWLPDTMGTIQLHLVGFFPLVFLWMLIPGQQVRPLLYYMMTLIWAYSLPLWFALIDLLARAAASRAAQSDDPLLQLLNWAPSLLSSVTVTVIALVVAPMLTGLMLYGVVRGVHTLFRSAAA